VSRTVKCPECQAVRDPETDDVCVECHLRAETERLLRRVAALTDALREMVEWGEGCVTGRNCTDPECCRYGRARHVLASTGKSR
jgi:hypothetical protein